MDFYHNDTVWVGMARHYSYHASAELLPFDCHRNFVYDTYKFGICIYLQLVMGIFSLGGWVLGKLCLLPHFIID